MIPTIFHSDLTSGPNIGGKDNKGVFVTIWGKNFGASQGPSYITIGGGSVDNYPTWSDTKVCFQLGAGVLTGDIRIIVNNVASNGVPFTVRTGNIYFIDPVNGLDTNPGTFESPFKHIKSAYDIAVAGATTYIRAGTINAEWSGSSGWHSIMCTTAAKTGTEANPMAWSAYPNEIVTFLLDGTPPTYPTSGDYLTYAFRDNGGHWYTISNFHFNIQGGRYAASVGLGWRVVGNNVTSVESGYGNILGVGDDIKILGNYIHDCTRSTIGNMAHSIYIGGGVGSLGSNRVEVGWNTMYNNHNQGWEISFFHEGPRIGTIHDNIILNPNNNRIKGILVGGVDNGENPASLITQHVKVYNNLIQGCGLDWGTGIEAAAGRVEIYNNTIYETPILNSSYGSIYVGSNPLWYPDIIIKNNIIYNTSTNYYITRNNGTAPDWSFVEADNNCYYGVGNGPTEDVNAINEDPLFISNGADFHLQPNSPCIDRGLDTTSTVPTDLDGVLRIVDYIDLGAYEGGNIYRATMYNCTLNNMEII